MTYFVATPLLYTVNNDDSKETLMVTLQREFVDNHGITRFHVVTLFATRLTDHETNSNSVLYEFYSQCVDTVYSPKIAVLRTCANSCCGKPEIPRPVEFEDARAFHEHIAKTQSPPFIKSNISISCKDINWNNSVSLNSVEIEESKYKNYARVILSNMLEYIEDAYDLENAYDPPNIMSTVLASVLSPRRPASTGSLSGKL